MSIQRYYPRTLTLLTSKPSEFDVVMYPHHVAEMRRVLDALRKLLRLSVSLASITGISEPMPQEIKEALALLDEFKEYLK
jgi:hypothetical protein